jgi:hypothetical protein
VSENQGDGVEPAAKEPAKPSASSEPRERVDEPPQSASPARSDESKPVGASPFISAQLSVILTLIPILIVFFRVARVSGFEPSVLATLVQTVDVFRLTLVTAMEWGPPLILLATGLAIVSLRRAQTRRAQDIPIGTANALATVLILCILTCSPQLLAIIAILIAVDYILGRGFLLLRRGKEPDRARVDFSTMIFILVVLFVIAPNTVWLPAQKIELRKSQFVVGYVLDEDDERTVILTEKDRMIRTLSTNDVVSKEPCRLKILTRPLLAYVVGGPTATVARCPSP